MAVLGISVCTKKIHFKDVGNPAVWTIKHLLLLFALYRELNIVFRILEARELNVFGAEATTFSDEAKVIINSDNERSRMLRWTHN